MTGLLLAGIVAAVVFVACVVACTTAAARGERRRRDAFQQCCRSLGLSAVAGCGNGCYAAGEYGGAKVVLGYCARGRAPFTAGILLLMETGVLPGGHWGADLAAQPPRLWGKGEGRDALARLLDATLLSAARHLPHAGLFPADDLLTGGMHDQVIRSRWQEGWRGLGLSGLLPLAADEQQLRAVLQAACSFRALLRAA